MVEYQVVQQQMDKTGSSNSKTDKNEFNGPESSNETAETANQTVAAISSASIVDTNLQSSLVKNLNHEETEVVSNSSEHGQRNQVRKKTQEFIAANKTENTLSQKKAKSTFYLYVPKSARWERFVKQSEYYNN